MKIKKFLRSNRLSRYPYLVLYHIRYYGVRAAVLKICLRLFGERTEYESGAPGTAGERGGGRERRKPSFFPINNQSYKLPDLLLESEEPKTFEILSCAFRRHEPGKGLTGGPNGVLACEREVFGNLYHGMRMRYLFHSVDVEYPEHLERALKGLSFMVRINFYAAYYLEYCINSWSRLSRRTDFLFVCHDLGFAYGAYLRKCRYVLVWHAQGSMVHERESFGERLSDRDRHMLNRLEEIVLGHAEAVYFPSRGAKDSYLATTHIDTARVNFAEQPLYNTIPDAPEQLDREALLKKLPLLEIDRSRTDVFLSVGDFSENKGVDRIPEILNAYARESGREIYWIAIGSRHKAGIYERLLQEQENWSFRATLIGERVDHDTLLALMDYTDYYIMMQRHSIFDLSTLEAMRAGKALVLSAVGGNLEVNRRQNVILMEDDRAPAIARLKREDKKELGRRNRQVFEEYFSKACFFREYSRMIDRHVMEAGVVFNRGSELNRRNLSRFRQAYRGRRAVICGAGRSLEACSGNDREAVYFALNRALFYDKIHFDFLFMQDYPRNQPYTMEDYNRYPCRKFYGIITNPGTVSMGLKLDSLEGQQDITYYELAPMWYDPRVNPIRFRLDEECVLDAKSVAFSAIQFAVFAGFREIILYGIDFSELNYGGIDNPNRYAEGVAGNLIAFKRAVRDQYPEIRFTFGATENPELREAFRAIDGAGERGTERKEAKEKEAERPEPERKQAEGPGAGGQRAKRRKTGR